MKDRQGRKKKIIPNNTSDLKPTAKTQIPTPLSSLLFKNRDNHNCSWCPWEDSGPAAQHAVGCPVSQPTWPGQILALCASVFLIYKIVIIIVPPSLSCCERSLRTDMQYVWNSQVGTKCSRNVSYYPSTGQVPDKISRPSVKAGFPTHISELSKMQQHEIITRTWVLVPVRSGFKS